MLSLERGAKAAFTLLSRAGTEATVMGKTASSGKGRPERVVGWPDGSHPYNILTTVVFLEHKQDRAFF